MRLLSEQWARQGKQATKVPGLGLGDVLHLMLRTPGKWKAARDRMLELFLSRLSPLLVGVGGQLARYRHDRKPWEGYPAKSRHAALRAVAVAGILLNAIGRERRSYMNDTAFQLGRLLAFADTLHREYCVHVRSGSIPPQLIGNALMPAAAGNPEDAIDRLRERMSIYQAWANKSFGEEYRLAKWAVGKMGQICSAIKRPLPTKTDSAFRAELFLGYLARPGKEDGDPQQETIHGE